MSVPVPTPRFFNPHVDSGGNNLQVHPPFLIENKESENLSRIECQPFKKPRISEIIVNPRMPAVPNRATTDNMFKTRQCTKFRLGNCPYGGKCLFAHGIGDIRKPLPHRQGHVAQEDHSGGKWIGGYRMVDESKLCRMFSNGKKCTYGDRCHFLHETPEKLRRHFCRESSVISLTAASSTADNRNRFGQLECNRFVHTGLNAKLVNPKPMIYKSRICNKWRMTNDCPFGSTCNFAHGQAELQNLGTHTTLETETARVTTSMASTVKHASTSRTEIGSTYKQQDQRTKCIFKWKGLEHISRIYADWIEDMPHLHSSMSKVES